MHLCIDRVGKDDAIVTCYMDELSCRKKGECVVSHSNPCK